MVPYRDIIESRYNRQNWQLLLHDIFGNKVKFWNTPSPVSTSSQFAKQALWLGTITLSDEQTISIYEVELAESVDIERNRRGIRDMLLTAWRNNGNAGAFMFCYRKNESVLRFSYVSESWTFADDGSYKKESTDTKRFTYLLGEGHRSRTAIQQFEKLRDSALSLKDLTKAFSVEAVGDMFFKGYKQQYEDIIFHVTGKRMVKVGGKWEERQEGNPNAFIMQQFARFANPEKAVRDYVKKLMGRLVFLQFLQKKGWLGVPVQGKWGDGDPEFIQNLFSSCKDKDHFIDNVLEALFNDLNTERTNNLVSPAVGSRIRVPYLNGGLFEREAADETEFPLPAQYMQSLLDFFASYNFTIDENDPDDAEVGVDPEMLGRIFENLLEDNKDKGAFYTPKEIVTYMCRESLIAYLQTDIEDEPTKEAIRQFVTTHDVHALGTNAKFLQQVDDALKDVKICDPAIGSGAFPMGLLKELFLCRTALEGISQHQAAEIKKHIIQKNIYGVDIERGAVDIARLRFWLALIVDEETPQALPNLDFKIMQGNSLLEQYKSVDLSTMTEKKADESGMLSIFDNMLDVFRLDLRKMLDEYYNCTDHHKKQDLRARIIDNVKQQLREQSIDLDFGTLDLSGNDQFFLWHTWFYDVFLQGGFDIVIGNPPYVVVPVSLYANYEWNNDLYKIFFELSLKELCRSKGIVSMITPKFYLLNKDDNKMRLYFMNRVDLLSIATCNPFDAVTENVITIVRKDTPQNTCIPYLDYDAELKSFVRYDDLDKEYCKTNKYNEMTFGLKADIIPILQKMFDSGKSLGSLTESKRGAEVSKNFLRDNDSGIETLIGQDMRKYSISWSNTYLPTSHKEYRRLRNFFESEAIYLRRVDSMLEATISLGKHYGYNKNVYGIRRRLDCDYGIRYLLACINSKVVDFYYKKKFSTKKTDVFPEIQTYLYEQLPIPSASKDIQNRIENLVDEILTAKLQSHGVATTSQEQEVDNLFYHLYGLTYNEVLIVDPQTQITREEYEDESEML